jgi:FlaA1/EpsC-like NDP-sugar epimerase
MPKRKFLFLLADIILILLSVFLAFIVRFEGSVPSRYFLNIWGLIISVIIFTLPIFYFLKLYSFSWSYVSTEELISLVKATTLSFLFVTASFFILRDHRIFSGFPRSTLFITFFFIFIFCGGIRFAKRIYLQTFRGREKGRRERTLIVGAGDAGEQILRNILSSRGSPYFPIGFVDDSPAKQGMLIHGIRVLGKTIDIPKIVQSNKVEGLIIALPSAGSQPIRRAVEEGRQAGLTKIKIVPPINELINGEINLGNLKDLGMEDLLGREPVVLDEELIDNFIKGKRVLVTGAAGSIGSELCRQIIKFNPGFLFLLDQDETGIFEIHNELKSKFRDVLSFIGDIREGEKIERLFKYAYPEIVFHAAAYKHVPLMEENPDEAVKNNIFGTEVLTQVSARSGVKKFIFISTDKAVNPSSVMGATKRVGEMICQAWNDNKDLNPKKTKFISVRFGNVLGSRGSIIPLFKEKIKKRERLEITHPDMKRYFMTIPEACLLVMEAGAMGIGGEVFVLDMGDPIKIFDLAKALIKLSGLEPDKDIPIVFSQPRPGEKFFEDILTAEEGTTATQNKKIYKAKLSKTAWFGLQSNLDKLNGAADKGDKKTIIKVLKEIIPTYKSINY